MILPVRPKEPLHAFATSFRNMNKDAAVLVDKHGVLDVFNVGPNMFDNRKQVAARRTLMVCIYNQGAMPEAGKWPEALNSTAVKYAGEG
jgi:hypothetical protein